MTLPHWPERELAPGSGELGARISLQRQSETGGETASAPDAVPGAVGESIPPEPAVSAGEPESAAAAPSLLAAGPPPSGAAAASSGAKAAELDELARRLYEPLTARLRAELWLDRERTGRSMTR